VDIVRRVHSMRELSRQARVKGQRIGFVPTMGALHDGHAALIRRMSEHADVVVVSVFVNPTQFGPREDLEAYPRDLIGDTDRCIREGADYLFVPGVDDIYPEGPRVWVDVPDLGDRLEGAQRPGHFRGVATVVLKLFHIVQPHATAFGQKDAQQVAVVRRLIEDLMLDIELHVVPTARDPRGLALSSRNRYLSPEQYEAALAIPRALTAARQVVEQGQQKTDDVRAAVRDVLDAEPGLAVDYVELVHPQTLVPVGLIGEHALLLVAVRCGETRLIDNALLVRP
jgi:pantoate--beta-alanine ligase